MLTRKYGSAASRGAEAKVNLNEEFTPKCFDQAQDGSQRAPGREIRFS